MRAVDSGLCWLPSRLAVVLRQRHGVGCEPHSLEQIGERLGTSKEAARQGITRALRLASELVPELEPLAG